MPGKRKHSGRPKRKKRRRRTVQVSIHWRMHGGRRRGAGRKPRGKRGGVPHRSRGEVLPTTPVHVGLKVAAEIGNLRHPTLFGPLRAAIYEGADSFGMRVIHYSVVKDHLHFIVEAESSAALSRGMQGLTIRMAKRINKVLGRRGKVFIDRYWSHVLRSPSETRAALNYVLKINFATTGSAASYTDRSGSTIAPPARDSPAGKESRSPCRTTRCPSAGPGVGTCGRAGWDTANTSDCSRRMKLQVTNEPREGVHATVDEGGGALY